MSVLVVALVAALASILTFFSGFGLGTLLLPAFAMFFPIEVAIAATAVVHMANNILRVVLLGRGADKGVVLRFGVPAVLAAIAGAWVLTLLGEAHVLHTYRVDMGVGVGVGVREAHVTWIGIVIGALMIVFAALELAPAFARLALARRYLPLGGVLSGFFGGLSGHQGALRTAFLVRCGLSKEQLLGTNAVVATMVDATRLVVYALGAASVSWSALTGEELRWPLLAGIAAALAGTLLGKRVLAQVTLRGARLTVGVMLLVVGGLLGAGVV